MNSGTSVPTVDVTEEISALIATLHETGHRLEELTAGEVDAVTDRHGRTFLLRNAQEQLRQKSENTLRESERRFSDLLQNVDLASVMLDRDARITFCNEFLLHLTGRQLDDVIGQNWFELFIPPELRKTKEIFEMVLHKQPKAWHHENEILTRSGKRRLIRWNTSLLRSEAGDAIGVASIGEDITELKQIEVSIKRLNRVYAVLSGINTLIVRSSDRDELFKGVCRIATEAGGFSMAMIILVDRGGMMTKSVASAGMNAALVTAVEQLTSSQEHATTTMIARAVRYKTAIVSNDSQNDTQVLLGTKYAKAGVRSIAVLPLVVLDVTVGVLALYSSEKDFFRDDEMKLLTELAGDVSFAIDHIEKQERLNYLAYYDVLTGTANRTLFLERVAQYIRSATAGKYKLALFLVDLERFKNINDSLGQTAGDALLSQVADWLARRAGDANLIARIGADHFAMVLPEITQEDQVEQLLEKTISAFMQHPFRLNDAVFRIAAKIGVALFPDDGNEAGTLFRNAEAALKKAKMSGERYLFHSHEMTAAVASKLSLENQLRQALDKQEFVLYYQPKINLDSHKLVGAEALIRWNDPRTGMVPPSRFIPVLEETGLIHEVGRWAMRKAIEDYLRWRAAGLKGVPIAVNVSPLQLRNRGFVDEIRQSISVDAHAAAGLELEITESLIMEDVKHSIASLKTIRTMGIGIVIDDFGTGFSSLSYLSKLPLDTLKIDRSFVNDMTSGPEGLALVSSIITLAHSLKLKVVAEGVESAEQSRLLRLLNCDEVQGFFYSNPLPSEILEKRYLIPTPALLP